MKSSSICIKNELTNLFRFDASFHLSEGQSVKHAIKHSPYKTLSITDVTERIFYGGRARRVYVNKRANGIPFLSSSDILQADLENVKLASRKFTPGIEDMKLQKGWTLISRSGTIGNCAFATAKHAQKLASEDVIRLVPNNILRQGMLFAYLASKYGHSLLTQGTFGAVIQHIEPDFIGSLPIPDFPEDFQQEIDDMIQESARLREEATDALNEAVELFEAEIGKSNVNLGFNSKSIHSSAIIGDFIRFDAQYQIGKSQITKYPNSIKIGNVAKKVFIGNRGKRYYVAKGVPFLSSSDMMLANPLLSPKQISTKTPGISDMIVSNRDILISRSGTVGNTIIVGERLSGVAVSEHAMRLVIDSKLIAPEYVFAYLKTQHGHDAMQVLPYGSVIITLGEEYLKDIDLPILPKDVMTQINKLVSSYISKIDDSMQRESTAIAKVEQEIEKWNK